MIGGGAVRDSWQNKSSKPSLESSCFNGELSLARGETPLSPYLPVLNKLNKLEWRGLTRFLTRLPQTHRSSLLSCRCFKNGSSCHADRLCSFSHYATGSRTL